MNYRQLVIVFLIVFNGLAFCFFGGYGVLASILFSFFSVPLWSEFYMKQQKLTLDNLKEDCIYFVKEGLMRLIVLVAFHVIIWLKIGWSTLYVHLFEAYSICVIIGFIVAFFHKNLKDHIYVFAFAVAPLFVSLTLILNYTFSSNPYQETYSYVAPTNHRVNQYDKDVFIMTPRILLKDHAYGDYKGMRSFFSRNEFKGNKITYTFEKGLFGFTVVKEWEFHRSP